MYIDRNGEPQVQSSPSVMEYEPAIFTPDVRERFVRAAARFRRVPEKIIDFVPHIPRCQRPGRWQCVWQAAYSWVMDGRMSMSICLAAIIRHWRLMQTRSHKDIKVLVVADFLDARTRCDLAGCAQTADQIVRQPHHILAKHVKVVVQ